MQRAMRTVLIKQQANIINIITNKYEPQQKHRLGTVSKKKKKKKKKTGGGA